MFEIRILRTRPRPLLIAPRRNYRVLEIFSGIAQEHVGKGWVTRFINKHHDKLVSRWTSGMDFTRHEADSETRYKLYFDLVHSTIEEYEILPRNTYNMDEKGFMIGHVKSVTAQT
jgi:ABC-type transport system substrate-binding protein